MNAEQRKILMKRCGIYFKRVYDSQEEGIDVLKIIYEVMMEEGIRETLPCIQSCAKGYHVMLSNSEFYSNGR